MSVNVVIGGVTYQVPETGNKSWGDSTTDTIVALAALSGAVDGTKTNSLTADAVFTTFEIAFPLTVFKSILVSFISITPGLSV